jgi:predicted Rossmann fold flavoprotein
MPPLSPPCIRRRPCRRVTRSTVIAKVHRVVTRVLSESPRGMTALTKAAAWPPHSKASGTPPLRASYTRGVPEEFDIVVVGGGAAGLMAAIFAGREARERGRALRIVVLDGASKIGAKILISGGGRCNVTNREVSAADFNGNRNQIGKVLRSLPVAETVSFFEEIGVPLKTEETGKLFPVTDRARTVVDALITAVGNAGATISTGRRATSVVRDGDPFRIESTFGPITAACVVLATGGRSVPKTGSDGGGYSIAQSLGHSVTPTFPALVPLLLPAEHWLTRLSGISVDAAMVLTSATGRVLQRLTGSMLFTHFGLSGPLVLDMSRHWIAARSNDPDVLLFADFALSTPDRLEGAMVDAAAESPLMTLGSLLQRWVPQRLAAALLASQSVDPSRALSRLTRDERRTAARSLSQLPLPVVRDRGYDYAEVTAGGVPLSEIDLATMASRRCRGLYLCGEILDVDGRIGGFNFQWAWATGRLAGLAAARATGARRELAE